MNVLHISTLDRGGAATSALRLHKGLLETNISSVLLTSYKSKSDIPKHFHFQGKYLINKPPLPTLTLSNYFKEKFTGSYLKALNDYTLEIERRKALETPKFERGIY